MKLNCKPGDLAVIVKSYAGNEGKIVTCLRLATHTEIEAFCMECGDVWLIDRAIMQSPPSFMPFIHDDQLRPLRDNPGQDEILRIVDLPEKEPA